MWATGASSPKGVRTGSSGSCGITTGATGTGDGTPVAANCDSWGGMDEVGSATGAGVFILATGRCRPIGEGLLDVAFYVLHVICPVERAPGGTSSGQQKATNVRP